MSKYEKKEVEILRSRLAENPKSIIFIAGPRQVGKTTLVIDALSNLNTKQYKFAPADQPDTTDWTLSDLRGDVAESISVNKDAKWLVRIWQQARVEASRNDKPYILVIDEIQKIPDWSEAVKGLWDFDRANKINLHIVLLGSSPLLMQQGMSESLAGRYELIRITHWSFIEMNKAFNFTLDQYIYFGGYPGGASLIRQESRWRDYVRDSLIQPSIDLDILMMTRVDKPALLKQLFKLSCSYSGQILAYSKLLGQLQDAGNTVTLASYLDKLGDAGLIVGLNKYASQPHRRRSVPKLNVLNTALMSVESGYTFEEALADRTFWGRMVESAVGAHLHNSGHPEIQTYYWRESPLEVDFVLNKGKRNIAIEVKSGAKNGSMSGLNEFEKNFGKCRKILIGNGGTSIVDFLSYPAEHWFEKET